jgi:hypothetical protein
MDPREGRLMYFSVWWWEGSTTSAERTFHSDLNWVAMVFPSIPWEPRIKMFLELDFCWIFRQSRVVRCGWGGVGGDLCWWCWVFVWMPWPNNSLTGGPSVLDLRMRSSWLQCFLTGCYLRWWLGQRIDWVRCHAILILIVVVGGWVRGWGARGWWVVGLWAILAESLIESLK